MLRAALIGFPSSGKTTLFQLMTSAKDAPRGKGDVTIGISKVPDAAARHADGDVQPAEARAGDGRVHRHHRRRAQPAPRRWSTSPATRTPTRSSMSSARFARPVGCASVRVVDPARDAQAMEDELILADLGVAERRLERIEKDLKKGRSAELERERDLVQRCRIALEEGTPLRALELAGDDLKRLRGFQFLSAKPLLLVINLDESQIADVGADVGEGGSTHRPRRRSSRTPPTRRSRSAPRSSSRSPSSKPADADGVPSGPRPHRVRTRSRHPRRATTCSATCRSSPSAKTNAAPGRSRAAPPRSSPPARSTATSSAASFAPKSSPTTR